MQPYMTGTITAEADSEEVVGVDTHWTNTIHQGDLLIVNNKLYSVNEIIDDTHLTIFTKTQEAFTNASYFIARTDSNWGSNADVASKVTETMDLYKNKLLKTVSLKEFSIATTEWADSVDEDYSTNYKASITIDDIKADQLAEVFFDKSCFKVAVASGVIADITDNGIVYFYSRKIPTATLSGKLRVI